VAQALDPVQEASMKEECILVDEKDRVLGSASKKDCHRVGSDGSLLLHRAFSVFLFNSKNELLVQKRSSSKITFPDHYTNACCSHPLFSIDAERNETDAVGIKLAAKRRLNHELGIPFPEVSINDFTYLTRIIYKSLGDGLWGEYEVDYILFLQKDVTIDPNPDEVSEVSFVARDDLDDFLQSLKAPVTPWFRLIVENRLRLWWDNLQRLNNCRIIRKFTRFSHTFVLLLFFN